MLRARLARFVTHIDNLASFIVHAKPNIVLGPIRSIILRIRILTWVARLRLIIAAHPGPAADPAARGAPAVDGRVRGGSQRRSHLHNPCMSGPPPDPTRSVQGTSVSRNIAPRARQNMVGETRKTSNAGSAAVSAHRQL